MAERRVPVSLFQGDLEAARNTLRENSLLALEQQVAVLEWLRLGKAMEFFEGYIRTGPQQGAPHKAMVAMVRSLLEGAPTYYVSPDMTVMIEHATDALGEHPDEGLSPLDLLTASGFLYFDKPIDIRANAGIHEGRTVPIRAIAWQQDDVRVLDAEGKQSVEPGLSYFLYIEPADAARLHHEDERAKLIRDVRQLHEEQGLGELPEPIVIQGEPEPMTPDAVRSYAGPLVLFDHSGWAFGKAWKEGDPTVGTRNADGILGAPVIDADGNTVVPPIVAGARRLLLATWKMLSQVLVQTSTERAGRPLRRRAGRVIPDPQDVIVVRLRREYDPAAKYTEETGEELEGSWYTHRFLVRGHWRRQVYGHARAQSKIIWIAPFIKGPKDAPLVVKTKVYSLEA